MIYLLSNLNQGVHMTKTPAISEGARYERTALRTKLERLLKRDPFDEVVKNLLSWIRTREKRYDKRKGGL